MDPVKIAPFVRYALMILTGWLSRGGWLDDRVGIELSTDPVVIETVTAALVGAATLGWYLISWSRKALKDAVGR